MKTYFEFGVSHPFHLKSWERDTSCPGGCTIYCFGPFFFTIKRGACYE